jgi:iron complex transport system substrate-binding protein
MSNKTKIICRAFACFVLAAALFCLSACRQAETDKRIASEIHSTRNGFPRTLRDGGGADVTLKTRPVRIASQTLGTDEILWEICSRERLIGISKLGIEPKYCVVAEELKAARIAPIAIAEEILQLQPDLVFVASFSRAETVESLQAAGATIFRFANFDSLEDIQQNIRLVGQAIGEEANAEKLIGRMKDELAAVKARIPKNSQPPRVLSYSLSGNTAGAKTSFDAIVRAAGAVNVAAEQGLSAFPKISAEQVVAWQPDFIVFGAEAVSAADAQKQLLEHPVIATTEAARNGRIIALDTRYLLSVSQYITRSVRELAEALYRQPAEAAEVKAKTAAR